MTSRHPVGCADRAERRRGRRRGFTLIEVLACLLFIAITLPVATNAILTANRLGALAVRTRQAVQQGDAILNQLIATGEWQDGVTSGDFGEEWPDTTWELFVETWAEESVISVTQLTLEVTFYSQDQEHVVELVTLVVEDEVLEELAATEEE